MAPENLDYGLGDSLSRAGEALRFGEFSDALSGWVENHPAHEGIFIAEELAHLLDMKRWTVNSHFGGVVGLHPEINVASPGVGWAYLEKSIAVVIRGFEHYATAPNGLRNVYGDAVFGELGYDIAKAARTLAIPIDSVTLKKRSEITGHPKLDPVLSGWSLGQVYFPHERSEPYYLLHAGITDPVLGAETVLSILRWQLNHTAGVTDLGKLVRNCLNEEAVFEYLRDVFAATQKIARTHLFTQGFTLGEYLSASVQFYPVLEVVDAGAEGEVGWRGVAIRYPDEDAGISENES